MSEQTEPVVKCQLCGRLVKDDAEGRFNHAWDRHSRVIVVAFYDKIYSDKIREVREALEIAEVGERSS